MKKICSLVLSAVMIMTCFGVNAYAQSDMYDEAIFNVKSIGLMIGATDGEFYPEKEISRAEFAAIVSRLCGLGSSIGTSDTVFADVPESMWASGYINAAYNLGIIDGFVDGTFRPDSLLTGEQALKMIVCALGYEIQAKSYGEYPAGYLTVAAKLGIGKDVDIDLKNSITRGDVAILLNDALDVHPMERLISPGEESYEISADTLYEKLVSIGKTQFFEGVVTANHVTALGGESNLEENEVLIDGQLYNVGTTNAGEYLGQTVRIFVEDSSGKIPVIVSVKPLSDLNNILVLDVDDIESIATSGMTYCISDDKTKTISFDLTDYFIYNGKAIKKSDLTNNHLKIINGTYTLLDADGDKKYETLFMDEYESFVVERIYADGKTIYFANDEQYLGRSGFKFRESDEGYIYSVIGEDGQAASFDDIIEGCVVSIAASLDGKNATVRVSYKKASGKVTEISQGSNEIYIDDTLYPLALDSSGNVKCLVSLGDEAAYVVDSFGYIVATDGQSLSGERYAWVIDAAEASFSESAKIKLALPGSYEKIIEKEDNTEEIYYEYRNSEIKIFELANNLRVDGYDDSNISDLKERFIGYTLDGSGNIKKITVYGDVYDKYSLNFNAEIRSFGGYTNAQNFFLGSATQVICVPSVADSDEDWYEKIKLADNSDYSVFPANVNDNIQTAEAVMIVTEMDADAAKPIEADAEFSIVGEVSSIVASDGNECLKIKLLTGSVVENVICTDSSANYNLARTLRKGDIIRYSRKVNGTVDKIERRASVQSLSKFYNTNKNTPVEEIYGLARSIRLSRLSVLKNEIVDEISVMIGSDDSSPYSEYEILKEDGPQIYAYDRKNGNIYPATTDDIETFMETGTGACKIFMLINSNNPEVVVIIKD